MEVVMFTLGYCFVNSPLEDPSQTQPVQGIWPWIESLRNDSAHLPGRSCGCNITGTHSDNVELTMF